MRIKNLAEPGDPEEIINYYEVANGITTAVRRNRIPEEDGIMFVEELQATSLPVLQ